MVIPYVAISHMWLFKLIKIQNIFEKFNSSVALALFQVINISIITKNDLR